MLDQRNRHSPRTPNEPWRGPATLTVAETAALFAAFLLAALVWLALGSVLPGGAFLAILTRCFLTALVGGLAAALLYAMADANREPWVRQHLTYCFRRHLYQPKKERATHATHATALPLASTPPSVSSSAPGADEGGAPAGPGSAAPAKGAARPRRRARWNHTAARR